MKASEYGVLFEEWWCGDEYCDCHQFQIVKITPRQGSSIVGLVDREMLWQGRFRTDGEQPTTDDVKEAVSAIIEHGAWVPANDFFRTRMVELEMEPLPIHPKERDR